MRIQEHIYQGFFGIKKERRCCKKYYHTRVEKLKGFDKDLDAIITDFQKILLNHNTKLKTYQDFLANPSKEGFQAVFREIEKLEGMFDEDELANNREQKHTLKNIDVLKKLSDDEESSELVQLEKESVADLEELSSLLEAIEPVWQNQIDFIKNNSVNSYNDSNVLKALNDILQKEGRIMRMEESLLRKIDLKTGSILRKTTLKERGIEKTRDMNMQYREIKHIR
jgi:hypothetical protein